MKPRRIKENPTYLQNLLTQIEDIMNMFAKDIRKSSLFSIATGETA